MERQFEYSMRVRVSVVLQQVFFFRSFVVITLFLSALGVIDRPSSVAFAQITNILDGPLKLQGTATDGQDDWDNVYQQTTTEEELLDFAFDGPDTYSDDGNVVFTFPF